ncbi:MAG: endonuclease III [Thermoplasmata archaeon]|nr:endonuclease III [Thermoplasmata archaeon]
MTLVKGRPLGSNERKAEEVESLLTSVYGRKKRARNEDPVDTLVETILSQNTTDINSGRAFSALKRRYPDWEEMLDEPPETLAEIIRSGGLAEIKAKRIIGALRLLKAERGEITLDFLADMTPKEAETWLASIDGVGPKTAAIVLLFSFGMPAFPVDTHIFRVSKRLGLIGGRASRESAQSELGRLIPPKEYYSMHLNLIEHGRRTCRPRNPRCNECFISGLCAFHRNDPKA